MRETATKTTESTEPIFSDAEPRFLVRRETNAVRCEICHQVDLFNPATGHCIRCAGVELPTPATIPHVIENEGRLPEMSSLSLWRHGFPVAFAVMICLWAVRFLASSLFDDNPEQWFESVARFLLNPQWMVIAGLLILLVLTAKKNARRSRQLLEDEED